MKKSIVALAVLGSFAGVAAAESSVTLFGVIDAAMRYTDANGKHVYSLASVATPPAVSACVALKIWEVI